MVPVTHTSRGIGHEGRAPYLNPQRPGDEFELSLAIDKLIKANEHLHAQVTRHIVAGGPAKILYTRTGRSDLIAVRHAECCFDVGADLDRARTYTALALQAGNNLVELADFRAVLGFRIVHLTQPWPYDGFQVSQDIVVINARMRLSTTRGDVGNRLFNETSGIGFEVLRYRVFQIQVDVV